MKRYNFVARDYSGKKHKGEVESVNETGAVAVLQGKGLVVISLVAQSQAGLGRYFRKLGRIKLDEVVAFTRQFATMIGAGLPLTEALLILEQQAKGAALVEVIGEIRGNIEGGMSLADSLSKHEKVFGKIYIALVRAGEAAGVLDTILMRLADNMERQKEFRSKTKGAMIYPAIVTIVMIAVAIIMMVVVVPKLMVMYEDMNAEMPAVTKALIALSDLMVKIWYLIVGGLVGLFMFVQRWHKTEKGAMILDKLMLRLPIFGPLKAEIILTDFCRTLSLLVGAGISIIKGLRIVKGAVNNAIFEKDIEYAAKRVEKGMPLAVPLAESLYFPPILSQMVSVGEETGKLDEVLGKLAEFFAMESEHKVKGLTAALEPLIMIILAIGVGFLVMAIILPIYNLTSAI
jgi:type IV pilus assembly protein PilC